MRVHLRLLGAVLALGMMAACGTQDAQVPYAGAQTFEWGSQQLAGALLVGPATLDSMQVNVLVRQQNAAGLQTYAREVSDPSSPLYRRFLTPQQIADRFGASAQDYHNAASYFASQGLQAAGWPQRLTLEVAGSQTAMERAFGTHFGIFEKNGRRFVAPMSAPHLPAALPVSAVSNLVAMRPSRRFIIQPPRIAGALFGGYSPEQVQAAFDYTGAYGTSIGGTPLDGTGIKIGIIGTGPIDIVNNQDADAAALGALFHTRVAPIAIATVSPSGVAAGLQVSGIPTAAPATPNPKFPSANPKEFPYSADFQSPPPVTAPCNGSLPKCNPEDGEAQLDTQQASTLAPGSNVLFYLAYNASDCATFFPNPCLPKPAPPATPDPNGNYGQPQIGLVEADAEIQQAIADDTADVVSISWGAGEADVVGSYFDAAGAGYGPQEFAALASEGIAVFVASGDYGSAECLFNTQQVCADYPAGDPSVTSVGGVTAPLDESGQLTALITGWGTATGLGQGKSSSGGGTSAIFQAIPAQHAATGATMREQPDVSMLGDPATGVALVENAQFGSSGTGDTGGTSVAAPQMAAMWALVLEACQKTPACATAQGPHPYRLGNAAPLLYGIYALKSGAGSPPAALPYPDVFYDVVYGQNPDYPGPGPANTPNPNATPVPGYLAGAGYDEVTGIGVPFAGHLIQAVTGQAVP